MLYSLFNTLDIKIPHSDFFKSLKKELLKKIPNRAPIRFSVIKQTNSHYSCEVDSLEKGLTGSFDLFKFRKRNFENNEKFNVVFIIPTGVDASIGGHAGDGSAAARLMSSVCDNFITHPNVFNASDVNEMTENTLYVEGSILSRFLMGDLGLRKVKQNRILCILDDQVKEIKHAVINCINGARSTLGINVSDIILLDQKRNFQTECHFTDSKRASGVLKNIESLFDKINSCKKEFDAIALSTVLDVPEAYHLNYFKSHQKDEYSANLWGGAEALLTHCLSSKFNLPIAHSPQLESLKIAKSFPEITSPKKASEAFSMTFFHCILKGLHQSPKVVTSEDHHQLKGVISAEDVSAVVIPKGCLGLPTFAALEQEIPLIEVEGNSTLMKNDLSKLPWKEGKFYRASNYLEACGILSSLKKGLNLDSIKKPMDQPIKPFKEKTQSPDPEKDLSL